MTRQPTYFHIYPHIFKHKHLIASFYFAFLRFSCSVAQLLSNTARTEISCERALRTCATSESLRCGMLSALALESLGLLNLAQAPHLSAAAS